MTDVHYYRWCSQNDNYSQKYRGSGTNIYTVTYNEMNSGEFAANYRCTCKGYQYKGKCKHIDLAKQHRCQYGHDAIMGSPVAALQDMDKCPLCGSDTSVIKVAV